MDNYKQAARVGLRFNTTVGSLSVEQLFQLSQTQLTTAIKNQSKLLKKDNEEGLGFLDEASKVDATEQLRFDILKDVYLTKKEEATDARTKKERKENNERILTIIQGKKEGELQGKSIAELEAMLQD